jgi:hypothetical protein
MTACQVEGLFSDMTVVLLTASITYIFHFNPYLYQVSETDLLQQSN